MAQATLSIVSHGHGELVAKLLRDLSRQTIASQLEVILTLNTSEAGPDPDCYRGLDLTLIRNPAPRGFGANHNAALLASGSPWVVIVNPDIRIHDAAALERLLARHGDGEVGMVAPSILNSEGAREDSVRHNLDPFSLARRRLLGNDRIIDPDEGARRFCWVAGMFMALPLDSWRAVGGFDERYFLYCEDYDLCARVALRGTPIVIDDSIAVVHDARRTSHRSLRYLRWHLASLLRVWTSTPFWRIWTADLHLRADHAIAPTQRSTNWP